LIRIFYDKDAYYIQDGDGPIKSTNGTWLYADREVPLGNYSIFKEGQSLYRVEFIVYKLNIILIV
jgi:hypothetical protein